MNDGGPAFPVPAGQGGVVFNKPVFGMSLRDWFAGMALSGMMAHPGSSSSGDFHNNCDNVGKYAYAIADSMIAGRTSK